jgi:hypothetical protein
LHNSSASSFLEAFLLISVLSCCFNLNANASTSISKVLAKSFFIVRSDNNNEVLISKLTLDLLNEIENSWNEGTLKAIRKARDLMPFRVLAGCMQSVLITIIALFSLRY